MKYIELVNNLLKEVLTSKKDIVIYGQNIDAGSCLSGLTKGLGNINKCLTINTPNCENSLVGIGFGLMLNNTSSIYFMKQMDFLLLGIDHLVNTFNIVRQKIPSASFTIFPVNVDSGYEGPQAALNNINDFCSIAEIEAYSFTNRIDTEQIISKYLLKPGFRIMSPSQRLLSENINELAVSYQDKACHFFKYYSGSDVSIVCFNFSLPYGITLNNELRSKGISASLFSVNYYSSFDFSYIINDIIESNNLIIIDDSKSINKLSDKFLNEVYKNCCIDKVIILDRSGDKNRYYPRHDKLEIDIQSVIDELS